jgi:AraC-like DNA-binding protein
MNALNYPRTSGGDSIYAYPYNETWRFNSDSLFYKMATEGRSREVLDLLHHYYFQILEDFATRTQLDAELKKMRAAAQTYRSDLLHDEADYMEVYFMETPTDSAFDVRTERMKELADRAAKKNIRGVECARLFEMFHNNLDRRNYAVAFKLAAELLAKIEKLTEEEYPHKQEIYYYIGHSYALFRDYERAIPCFHKAIQGNDRLFADRSGLMARLELAKYYASLNQLDSADYYYRSLYDCTDRVRFRPSYDLEAINGIAHNLIRRGKHHEAMPLLQMTLPEAIRNNRRVCAADISYLMGICYLEQNRLHEAKEKIDAIRALLARTNLARYPMKAKFVDFRMKGYYELMSRYHAARGNFPLVMRYRDSVQIVEKEEIKETDALIMMRAEQETYQAQQALKEQQLQFHKQTILAVLGIVALLVVVIAVVLHFYRKQRIAYRELVRKSIAWAERKEYAVNKNDDCATDKNRMWMEKIYLLFEERACYTDPDFSINKLAELLMTNIKFLSDAINKVEEKNFSLFVNEYRIKEAVNMLKNAEYDKYSIDFIAQKSGFANRQSFYNAFKKMNGLSPSDFKKNR